MPASSLAPPPSHLILRQRGVAFQQGTQLGGYPNPEARVTSAGGRLRSIREKLVSPRVVWFGLSSPGGEALESLTGCYSGNLRGWGKLIGRRFVARTTPTPSGGCNRVRAPRPAG